MAPLTGASSDVCDVLRLIKNQGSRGALEAVQRGSRQMYDRLRGANPTRHRKDRFITGGDLRLGNMGAKRNIPDYRINPEEFLTMGRKDLTLDNHGFVWHRAPQSPQMIDAVVEQQKLHEAELQAAKGEKKEVVGKDVIKSDRVLRVIKEKRKLSPDEDVTPIKVQKPPSKRPSDQQKKAKEIREVFQKLNVVSEELQRTRADSLKKKKKAKDAPYEPRPMPIPVTAPTPAQKNIWALIDARTRAIAEKRVLNITKESVQAMQGPPNQVLKDVEEIARGLAALQTPNDSVLVYTQCMVDLISLGIRRQEEQTSEWAALRAITNRWLSRYGPSRQVQTTLGDINRTGSTVDHHAIVSLLHGDGYEGWLNDDIILAALRIAGQEGRRTNRRVHVVSPLAWTVWHERGNQLNDMPWVPEDHPSLVVIQHWTNHWALMVADTETREIHYYDSMPVEGRREVAIASLRGLLNIHPGYNQRPWHASDRTSPRQVNAIDCGVWAVLEGWAFIRRDPRPQSVDITDRVAIADWVVRAAQEAEQHRPPPPRRHDDVEFMGVNQLNVQGPQPQTPNQSPQTPRQPSRAQTPQQPTIQTIRTTATRGLTPPSPHDPNWDSQTPRQPSTPSHSPRIAPQPLQPHDIRPFSNVRSGSASPSTLPWHQHLNDISEAALRTLRTTESPPPPRSRQESMQPMETHRERTAEISLPPSRGYTPPTPVRNEMAAMRAELDAIAQQAGMVARQQPQRQGQMLQTARQGSPGMFCTREGTPQAPGTPPASRSRAGTSPLSTMNTPTPPPSMRPSQSTQQGPAQAATQQPQPHQSQQRSQQQQRPQQQQQPPTPRRNLRSGKEF